MVKVKEDLTGRKFERLTVKRQAEDYISQAGKHYARWYVSCDCAPNNEFIVMQNDLKRGKTNSCGCLMIEASIKNGRKRHDTNKYDLKGEYGIGYCHNTNTPFYFDLEDYDLIKDYCWSEYISSSGYHALRARDLKTNHMISMHYLIVGKYYDHINRNPLDNRKSNLRKATSLENMKNQSKHKNNTSGVSGVSWHKKIEKWCARIGVDNKMINLGCFTDKKDAIKARLEAELMYYGELSPQRHLYQQYGIEVNSDE